MPGAAGGAVVTARMLHTFVRLGGDLFDLGDPDDLALAILRLNDATIRWQPGERRCAGVVAGRAERSTGWWLLADGSFARVQS